MKFSNEDIGFNFGLEQEAFLVSDYAEGYGYEEAKFILPPESVSRDNAGYLVEARGDFFKDPYKVVFSLEAANIRIAHTAGGILWPGAKAKLPERLKLEAYRKYGLPTKDKLIANLYDESLTDEQLEWQYAGTHLNISCILPIYDGGKSIFKATMFDHVPIIKWLDNYFAKEIKESGRLRGSYSIKELEGGVGLEYRSLPGNIYLRDGVPGEKRTVMWKANVLEALVLLKKEFNL